MVDQGVAEPDPQLRIAGVAAHSVLENADRVLAITCARKRFGDSQPAFRRRELAEKGVPCLGQLQDVAALAAFSRRSGETWPALECISRRSEQQRRCSGLKQTALNTQQPQTAKAKLK